MVSIRAYLAPGEVKPGWARGAPLREESAGTRVRRACYWRLVGLLLCVTTFAGRASETSALIDRWCAAQTNVQTWSADLVQTRSLKVLTQPLVTSGKVWVKFPNWFRWELGQPPQTIALREPDQLLLIYPRLKRAEKYPLHSVQTGPWKDALALLDASFPRSRAELESGFQVLSATETNAAWQLVLRPRSAAARKFMTEIQVVVSTKDFTPMATELRFSDGSRMRNDFTNAIVNAPLPEGVFTEKLAPDITVAEPLGQ